MKTSRGFSLIELLVVIAIIAILVSLLLPVIALIRLKSQEAVTRSFIKSIETACSTYELDYGFYPPDGHAAPVTAKRPDGTTYTVKNSEALYYFLCTPFRVLPNPLKGEVQANKDGGSPYLTVPQQYEAQATPGGPIYIVDVWHRPLNYDNIRDPQASPSGFDSTGAAEIRDKAALMDNPGPVGRNLQFYDIWSMGGPGDGTATNCTRPVANFKCKWGE